MLIHACEESAAKKFSPEPSFMQQNRVSPEIDRQLSVKMPHGPQMTMIIPADHQYPVRGPRFNPFDQIGIDDPPEMMYPRRAGYVIYEFMLVPLQQRNIPLDIASKAGIIHIAATRLLPGIEYLD